MSEGIVPLIDIAPFLHGGTEDKARVAAEVDSACREIGFLVVSGHDVPAALIADMHAMSDEYFALPHWEKMRHKIPADRFRGYSPSEHHSLAYSMDEETPEDLREAFNMGPFGHAFDEYHFGEGGARYFAPNFCLNHYPAQPEPPKKKQLRGGAHCDYGSLTIVHTDTDIGGLQVFRKDGEWETVPRIAGTFAINIGDLMAEWTNNAWVSTLHHVTNPPREAAHVSKTSLLFFHQPNYDALVDCLPNCHGPDNPPKYAPTTSGGHITAKFDKLRAPEFEPAAK